MAGFETAAPDLKPLLGERISGLELKLEGSPMERYVADFRLAKDTVDLSEANPNPYLHSGHEFIGGARASGRTHADMMIQILEFARVRYAARPQSG